MKTNRTLTILIGAFLALIALPADAQQSVNNANCVRNDDIWNFKAFSNKLVMIESNSHRKVLLKLIGTCMNLTFANAIVVRSPGGTGLSCISSGDTLVGRGFSATGRCAIISVEPYTPGLEKTLMKPKDQ